MKRFVRSLAAAALVFVLAGTAAGPAANVAAADGRGPCLVTFTIDVLDCIQIVGRTHSRPLTSPETVHAVRVCIEGALQGLKACETR